LNIFVADFIGAFVTYQTQNTRQADRSLVAVLAILNTPVLSTVFEISQWSIDLASSTMAVLL
jgi:hypothetical protein